MVLPWQSGYPKYPGSHFEHFGSTMCALHWQCPFLSQEVLVEPFCSHEHAEK